MQRPCKETHSEFERGTEMKILFCAFIMDTACVELEFADGSMISIDTIAVENEVANN